MVWLPPLSIFHFQLYLDHHVATHDCHLDALSIYFLIIIFTTQDILAISFLRPLIVASDLRRLDWTHNRSTTTLCLIYYNWSHNARLLFVSDLQRTWTFADSIKLLLIGFLMTNRYEPLLRFIALPIALPIAFPKTRLSVSLVVTLVIALCSWIPSI